MSIRRIPILAIAVCLATIAAAPASAQTAGPTPLLEGQNVSGSQVFILNDDGGLAVFGPPSGAIPHEGMGSMLLWYPGRSAFRAGYVGGSQWDDGNIGDGSVALGVNLQADGDFSVVLGSTASAAGRAGAFVYGDASKSGLVEAVADNSFVVRASGGTTFYSDAALSAGVFLEPGAGSWSMVSDRDRKENFREEDADAVLRRVASLPITSWNYKAQDAQVRHIGPMAQDFSAAFGLGSDDRTITTGDLTGVALLAIQALEARTADLAELRAELDAARQELVALRATVRALAAAQMDGAPMAEMAR
jgi:hypothetical protein